VLRCGAKNGYKKNTYPKEITRRAQNLLIILGSIVNITRVEGGGDEYFMVCYYNLTSRLWV
jgi:hypothetical protein